MGKGNFSKQYSNSQKVNEKVLNDTSYQENANQNSSVTSELYGNYQKHKNNKCW